MAVWTAPSQRKLFYELHQQGQTFLEIAQSFGVSRECVRYWVRRQRKGLGPQSRYHRERPGLLSRWDPRVRYAVLRLKLEHPRWGPSRILNRLKKRPSLRGLRFPSPASVGRYLHQWPRFRRPARPKKPAKRPHPPTRVHQRWQIDFKLGIRLDEGSRVDLHDVWDPVGEACIGTFVYPASPKELSKHVPVEDVRTTLRLCFVLWGTLPEEVQTDGESTLIGKPNDNFPSRFTLWLVGLGIAHLIIRPGIATDNAEVERGHRTLNEYAIVGNEQASPGDLQRILTHSREELLFELPSWAEGCAGRPPIQAHPELLTAPRPFRPELELALFDLRRVDAYLASFTWDRRVDVNGVVYLGERYSLGRKYAHPAVKVRFDPADRHFVCFQTQVDGTEIELKRWPARHLEVEDLTGLGACPWPVGPGPQQLPLPLPKMQGVNCY
ncbi:MAG TPA: hypothetical protein VIV15_00040 [Anaerolineales bacterium]